MSGVMHLGVLDTNRFWSIWSVSLAHRTRAQLCLHVCLRGSQGRPTKRALRPYASRTREKRRKKSSEDKVRQGALLTWNQTSCRLETCHCSDTWRSPQLSLRAHTPLARKFSLWRCRLTVPEERRRRRTQPEPTSTTCRGRSAAFSLETKCQTMEIRSLACMCARCLPLPRSTVFLYSDLDRSPAPGLSSGMIVRQITQKKKERCNVRLLCQNKTLIGERDRQTLMELWAIETENVWMNLWKVLK